MRLICTTNKAYSPDLHVFELQCNWVVRSARRCPPSLPLFRVAFPPPPLPGSSLPPPLSFRSRSFRPFDSFHPLLALFAGRDSGGVGRIEVELVASREDRSIDVSIRCNHNGRLIISAVESRVYL